MFAGEVVPQAPHRGGDKGALDVRVLGTLMDHALEGMQDRDAEHGLLGARGVGGMKA